MDKERQLRLLIPPFFVVASLLWGAHVAGLWYPYFHSACVHEDASLNSIKLWLSLVGLIGVTTLPAGYLIGMVTIGFLRSVGKLFPLKRYDLTVRNDGTIDLIWKHLRMSRTPDLDFYAATFFDHAFVQNRIHEWQVRRWTAFNISTQSVTALVLSILLGHALGLYLKMLWWSIPVCLLIALLIVHSWVTWLESARMFHFAAIAPAALRRKPVGESEEEAD
jgi:hypothetical protein